MKKLLLSGLACASFVLAAPEFCFAHGGQYRGPGDVVPPNPGGGGGNSPGPRGPTTPGPSGPSTPGPAGPSTPGPAGPTTGGPAAPSASGPTTGGRGAPVGPDLTRWQFWWEFNKDPFINLKEAIHSGKITTGSDDFFMGGSKRVESKDSMKPSDSEILGRVLPDLKRALDGTDNRDITSSCMIAMAKIGKDHDTFKILDMFRPKLKSPDQEIRETAALAMGISQMVDAVPDLIDLALDTPKGRELVSRSEVDNQTRAFASYGLGLIAYATNKVEIKRQCFEAMKDVLGKDSADRNVPVAAINAIRLLRPNPEASDKDKQLLDEALNTLWTFYEKKLGSGEQQIQAHVPPAIAQLLGRGGDKTGKYKEAFSKELSGDVKRNDFIYQSAAVALGVLCQPTEVEKADKKYSDALLAYYDKGKDAQTRYFALIALGKIGGEHNRAALLKAFIAGNKGLEKPWAALALGVLAFHSAKKEGATLDIEIGRTLHTALSELKNPDAQAAISVALGLVKYRDAADDLQLLLEKYKSNDELAGYLCVGLALMGNTRSVDLIQSVVQGATRRPDLLKQAAIALGKLGDKNVTELLQTMLKDDNKVVARLSAIASALGYIGDRRTIDPLTKMLFDTSITELSRAFAAVALGGVSDKEPLPWNSKVAVDMNYRAAVETLTNGATGVLDIL